MRLVRLLTPPTSSARSSTRTDWGKRWASDPERAKALAADPDFPSVGLDALKFLHRKRPILFHGHVANLDKVPATRAGVRPSASDAPLAKPGGILRYDEAKGYRVR